MLEIHVSHGVESGDNRFSHVTLEHAGRDNIFSKSTFFETRANIGPYLWTNAPKDLCPRRTKTGS
jgi:hypothetical protein